MYRVKVQLDNGDVREVSVARVIIEGTGDDGQEQIHLIASHEGVIIDVVADDEVVATGCLDPDVLTAHCS